MSLRDLFRRRDPQLAHDMQALGRAIDRHELLSGIPRGVARRLIPWLRIKEFDDEAIECHCPDATHDAFLMLEGRAAVTFKVGDDEHVLEVQGEGGLFNIGALVGVEQRHLGARALGKARVLAVDCTRLRVLMADDPHLTGPMLMHIVKYLVRPTEDQMAQALTKR
jgi:CRP-like cAMP-binding protein